MNQTVARQTLQIKKYPNRRYYDTTRSCHVTLQEVHDLVVGGHDVLITDSRNGDDITNLVLLQILLEKDQPKLDLFPSSILLLMIRSNHQVLRASVERFFGPFMSMLATSQKQFEGYVRQAMHGQIVNPLQWASSMMQAFSGAGANHATSPPPDADYDHAPPPDESDATLESLRAQLSDLHRRLDELTAAREDDLSPGRVSARPPEGPA